MLIVVASPIVARIYETPQLIGLLFVLAIATPLGSLQLVPTAKLRTEMNFKALAWITSGQSVLQTLLTVGFAAWRRRLLVCTTRADCVHGDCDRTLAGEQTSCALARCIPLLAIPGR